MGKTSTKTIIVRTPRDQENLTRLFEGRVIRKLSVNELGVDVRVEVDGATFTFEAYHADETEVRLIMNENVTVPCQWCETPTPYIGTRECDACWELRSRLQGADPVVVRKMLLRNEALNQETFNGHS